MTGAESPKNLYYQFPLRSEYADWRPGFGAVLHPVPIPEEALAVKEVQESILMHVMKRLANDSRCIVHRVLLPIRELRPGWIHIAAPSSPTCPDDGELFGEMVIFLYRFLFPLFFYIHICILSGILYVCVLFIS